MAKFGDNRLSNLIEYGLRKSKEADRNSSGETTAVGQQSWACDH